MKQTGYIEHQGIVTHVSGNKLSVNLLNTASCSSCHVKGFCNVSDIDNKTIEIISNTNIKPKKGDKVIVNFEKNLGPKAMFLGYLFPFMLVFTVLLISIEITGNEALSGLMSLIVLIPYYLTLFVLRNHLKTKFAFKIKTLIH